MNTQTLTINEDDAYRAHTPWLCSSHSQTVVHGGSTVNSRWKRDPHEAAERGAICADSGWPAAKWPSAITTKFPADAERFAVWDNEEGVNWVNGELADNYLRKLKQAGLPLTTAARVAQQAPPSSEHRFGACSAGDAGACGCLCEKFEPSLVVPLTLADQLEITNDIRPIALQIVAESNVGIWLRRAGVERGDIDLDSLKKAASRTLPASHRLRYKVREERRAWLLEAGTLETRPSIEAQIERTEFELNARMLPDLHGWIEKFRAVKTQRLKEAARRSQEEANELAAKAAAEAGEGAESTRLVPWRDPEEAANLAERKSPHRCLLLCRCGHSKVWHAKPASASASMGAGYGYGPGPGPGPYGAATGAPKTLGLKPLGPASLMKDLPATQAFSMIAEAAKPRAPPRTRSEPSISGGRLVVAGAASLRTTAATAKKASAEEAGSAPTSVSASAAAATAAAVSGEGRATPAPTPTPASAEATAAAAAAAAPVLPTSSVTERSRRAAPLAKEDLSSPASSSSSPPAGSSSLKQRGGGEPQVATPTAPSHPPPSRKHHRGSSGGGASRTSSRASSEEARLTPTAPAHPPPGRNGKAASPSAASTSSAASSSGAGQGGSSRAQASGSSSTSASKGRRKQGR